MTLVCRCMVSQRGSREEDQGQDLSVFLSVIMLGDLTQKVRTTFEWPPKAQGIMHDQGIDLQAIGK